MENKSLKLQTLFEEAVKEYGGHVYFQAGLTMEYPAIKYKKSNIQNSFANNTVYAQKQYYDVTVMEYDPDKPLTGLISKLPAIQRVSGFEKDGLYHEVFTLYF